MNIEEDRLKINSIFGFGWLWHYMNLCTYVTNKEDEVDAQDCGGNVDSLRMEELDVSLKNCADKKAVGSNGLSVQLEKYGGILFKQCLLHLINSC